MTSSKVERPGLLDAETSVTCWIITLFPLAIAARDLTDGLSQFVLLGYSVLVTLGLRKQSQRQFMDVQTVAAFSLLLTSLAAWLIGAFITQTMPFNQMISTVLLLCQVFFIWFRLRTLPREALLRCLNGLFYGVAILLIVNVLGYLAGIESNSAASRVAIPSAISLIDDIRVIFPFGSSMISITALAAAFGAAFPALRSANAGRGSWQSWLTFAGLIAAIFIIIASGVRTAAIVGIVGLIGVAFLPKVTLKVVLPISIAALLLPLWWPTFGSVVAGPASALEGVPFFATRDTRASSIEEVTSFNTRTDVWQAVFNTAGESSVPHLIFGYGSGGQAPSGISDDTAYLFTFILTDGIASTHSSLLQQFVDQGLIGAALLLATYSGALYAAVRLARHDQSKPVRNLALATAGFLTILASSAAADVALSSGAPTEAFWIFLLITLLGSEYHTREKALPAVRELAGIPETTSPRPAWSQAPTVPASGGSV